MTLGRNSIFVIFNITNTTNSAKPHEVTVQANKNYGICDMSPRVGEILSDFQGQQINSEVVQERLCYALEVALNPKNED